MDRETTEENNEHRHPFDVLEERSKQSLLTDTVAHDSQRDVTETDEDNDQTEPHIPGVEVVLVEVSVEPTDGEVVDERQDPGGTNSVVCSNVRQNSNLGSHTNLGDQELVAKRRERTLCEPHVQRVEEQLVAAIGVLLPTGQLVVHGKRDTLLETFASPSGETNNVAVTLETQGHVEVFRHSILSPELLVVVLVKVGYLLDSLPAENSVVTDEGCDVTVGDGVFDGRIDQVGEIGDTVLEEGPGDLHDTGGELHDADFLTALHLGDGVKDTILWHTGVGVDNDNVVADTNVAVCPRTSVLVEDLLQRGTVGLGLVILVPVDVAVERVELGFDVAADHHTEIHVGGLLELSLTDETLGAVLGTGGPPDVVVGVEVDTGVALVLVDQLQTIVVEQHVAGATLKFVGRHGSFARLDGGSNDTLQTLLVHGALDSDVGKRVTIDRSNAAREQSRVETGVRGNLLDGTDNLGGTSDNDLSEEKREEDLDRCEDEEEETEPVVVDGDFDGDLTETGTEQGENDNEGDRDQDCVLQVGRTVFGKLLSGDGVEPRLYNTRALLGSLFLLLNLLLSRRPDQLHQLIFNELGTLDKVVHVIIPDDQQGLVSDESGELMLLGRWEILHGWQDLHTQTVGERNINSVRRPGKEGLDDTRVDRHGALNVQLDTRVCEERVCQSRRTGKVVSSRLLQHDTLNLTSTIGDPEACTLLLEEIVDHNFVLQFLKNVIAVLFLLVTVGDTVLHNRLGNVAHLSLLCEHGCAAVVVGISAHGHAETLSCLLDLLGR